ncbi:MAG: hypothetical protein JXM70_29260 [Pirellulales bacterium]|nr:hypothetical protein [Pirellulales bacterium]
MNELDKQLKEALAENGDYDPEKTAALKQSIVADFGGKIRWLERCLWAYLIICVIIALFAITAFQQASSNDTRSLLLYAIIFLVGFESTILIKIWYWIANMKVSMLKEIKLLRLGQSTKGEPLELATSETPRRPGLSRWEKIAWLIVLVVGALVVPRGLLPGIGMYEADITSRTFISLEADGSGTSTAKVRFRNGSQMPMTSFDYNAPADSKVQWLDQQGKPLVTKVATEGDRNCYNVALPCPLLPDEWFTYTRITKSPTMAQKNKDGLWLYRADESYGRPTNDFSQTVFCPEGAQFTSLEVAGNMEHAVKNERRIFVNGRRESNEPFRFTAGYRLPSEVNE